VQEAAIGMEVEVEEDTIVTRPREAVTTGRMVVVGGTAGRHAATMTVTGSPFCYLPYLLYLLYLLIFLLHFPYLLHYLLYLIYLLYLLGYWHTQKAERSV
jgi:hypothetical protein